MTLEEFSVTYIENYAMARNKKGSWKRKKVSLRALNKVLRKQNLESQNTPPRPSSSLCQRPQAPGRHQRDRQPGPDHPETSAALCGRVRNHRYTPSRRVQKAR